MCLKHVERCKKNPGGNISLPTPTLLLALQIAHTDVVPASVAALAGSMIVVALDTSKVVVSVVLPSNVEAHMSTVTTLLGVPSKVALTMLPPSIPSASSAGSCPPLSPNHLCGAATAAVVSAAVTSPSRPPSIPVAPVNLPAQVPPSNEAVHNKPTKVWG